MPLAEHNNMVKAFPPDRTDQPFSVSVLPGLARRRRAVSNTDGPNPTHEYFTVCEPGYGPKGCGNLSRPVGNFLTEHGLALAPAGASKVCRSERSLRVLPSRDEATDLSAMRTVFLETELQQRLLLNQSSQISDPDVHCSSSLRRSPVERNDERPK